MERKKIIYQLDTPYSAVSWPDVTLEDQETILELLCALLAPLGQYRSTHTQLSKGKRDRKRKRKASGAEPKDQPPPPIPELRSYIDVGLAAVTRSLEETASRGQEVKSNLEDELVNGESPAPPYSAIFVARSGQPNALNSHLPQMVAVASKSHPTQTPIRLVGLSKSCGDRLSESLGIPRISCIGIREEAPGSKALVEFTRRHVPAVEIQWLDQARRAEHLGTNINAIKTSVGSKREKPCTA
ncbi:hypothetical protein F4818DRAFT_213054 [Hypoxylon cercidicola]|nr:hypothetical protein F4818DRAFT_213054 [Hypoxylon cercidicola]